MLNVPISFFTVVACKVKHMGCKENLEQKLAKLEFLFPFVPICFYFTCRNSEGGRYIQNLKFILFLLVCP